jgi:hypothetical protein
MTLLENLVMVMALSFDSSLLAMGIGSTAAIMGGASLFAYNSPPGKLLS